MDRGAACGRGIDRKRARTCRPCVAYRPVDNDRAAVRAAPQASFVRVRQRFERSSAGAPRGARSW
ncbi:hypothetical protein C6Q05_19485 [Burkholderia multivorans]|nr:hypothetical protein C6Q05_19485 [Burkholderia multivorans]